MEYKHTNAVPPCTKLCHARHISAPAEVACVEEIRNQRPPFTLKTMTTTT